MDKNKLRGYHEVELDGKVFPVLLNLNFRILSEKEGIPLSDFDKQVQTNPLGFIPRVLYWAAVNWCQRTAKPTKSLRRSSCGPHICEDENTLAKRARQSPPSSVPQRTRPRPRETEQGRQPQTEDLLRASAQPTPSGGLLGNDLPRSREPLTKEERGSAGCGNIPPQSAPPRQLSQRQESEALQARRLLPLRHAKRDAGLDAGRHRSPHRRFTNGTKSSRLAIILGLNSRGFNAGLTKAAARFKRFGASLPLQGPPCPAQSPPPSLS